MLTIFLELVDRIILLCRERRTSDNELFAKHIDPLFVDLTAIHKDYAEAFVELEKVARACQSSEELRQRLSEQRVRMEYLRLKTKSIARIMRRDEIPPPALDFVEAVLEYFLAASGDVMDGSHCTSLLKELDNIFFTKNVWIGDETFRVERERSVSLVCSASDFLAYRWNVVANAYAIARHKLS